MRSQRFEHLVVFQRAYKASLKLHKLSTTFPTEELYGVTKQLRCSSKSVAANIAEGYGRRRSKADFRRFILISLGSSEETRVWLRYSLDLGFIPDQEWKNLSTEYMAISRMLSGLANTLD